MREFNKRLWDNTACRTLTQLFNCIVNLVEGEKNKPFPAAAVLMVLSADEMTD